MNPSSSAIVTAFNKKLPTKITYAYTSSTIKSDPVTVYFKEEINTYHRLFNHYFPRIGAATLQLIHSVNIALQQTCPRGTQIIYCTESTINTLLSQLTILEIKNTNIIHKDDFQRAALSKQAHKYLEHCPYVAIFNYSTIFLFSFLWQTTKPVCRFYFNKSRRTSGMTFRRLLFAFVVCVLKDYEARMSQKP
ncbi:uncharacterized protein BO87DRAFT_395929 [Aspergillus neoniger CBS 115656]|uniref:Uncharacterized protein n=1 Tax=Aspergillus neoniger (strain CBS 115656) TaxID=1448310 RepID=A0A318YL55_ASPNB|nr:hypothetical protein BO87DRAFT_395929 [Aspergillus neoniger CBS 115656]PYH35281.1 hypothetical protein BO87DRAFT_395929 [Aspergillus neoniger CBS 115656]